LLARAIRRDGSKPMFGIVKKNRANSWIVKHGAAFEQQPKAVGELVRPCIHLREGVDQGLALDRRSNVEPGVQNRTDVADGMNLKGAKEIEFESSYINVCLTPDFSRSGASSHPPLSSANLY
jgi:hypothetical protein